MQKKEVDIYRVLDANLNRASEGIRVIEDTFRFIKNNKSFYEKLRALRHKISKVLVSVYPRLIRSRNTKTDQGRGALEFKFKNIDSLIIANFKRVEQALRVLEEYSRLISPGANREFKKIRFKMYLLEKEFLNPDKKI